MSRLLPILGIAGGLCAAAAALHGTSQTSRLAELRNNVAISARSIDGHVTALGGQAAAVEERVQALRAVAATPEMPVSGAELQAQLDRLQSLRTAALAIAADDAGAAALTEADGLLAAARAAVDAFINDPAHMEHGLGRMWEAESAVGQITYEVELRRAVAESEGALVAARFDPWALDLDPAHYQPATYDAAAVAEDITYSMLNATEKTRWRKALADAGDDGDALRTTLAALAEVLGVILTN